MERNTQVKPGCLPARDNYVRQTVRPCRRIKGWQSAIRYLDNRSSVVVLLYKMPSGSNSSNSCTSYTSSCERYLKRMVRCWFHYHVQDACLTIPGCGHRRETLTLDGIYYAFITCPTLSRLGNLLGSPMYTRRCRDRAGGDIYGFGEKSRYRPHSVVSSPLRNFAVGPSSPICSRQNLNLIFGCWR